MNTKHTNQNTFTYKVFIVAKIIGLCTDLFEKNYNRIFSIHFSINWSSLYAIYPSVHKIFPVYSWQFYKNLLICFNR